MSLYMETTKISAEKTAMEIQSLLVQAGASRILTEIRQVKAEAARRLAVETWLQRNGVITITQNKKVLPVFPEKSAHN
jgi:hypothetical protein